MKHRAERLHNLPLNRLILVSVSQVLFVSGFVALLFLNLVAELGYSAGQTLLYLLWPLALLAASYILYRQVREVDMLDFLAGLLFYHRLRQRSKELDTLNTVLFTGLFLITLSPFIYTYVYQQGYSTIYAVLSLLLGGVFVALAVSGYVLLAEGEDH